MKFSVQYEVIGSQFNERKRWSNFRVLATLFDGDRKFFPYLNLKTKYF